MPVEIREITIKTQIVAGGNSSSGHIREKELNALRKRILDECRTLISNSAKRKNYKR